MKEDLNDLRHKILPMKDKLKTDSRKIVPGDVFVAIKGVYHDGHDFVLEALKRGARCVVSEKNIEGLSAEDKEKVVIVSDTREILADFVKFIYDDPSEHLSVYGVTGTNGKTSTVFLIDGILSSSGRKSGFTSTVFSKISGDIKVRSDMTTPDIVTMNHLLSEMVDNGKDAAVIEISSHALSQKRVEGIGLDSAVFMNITPEHLDYHENMDNYLEAKKKIFALLKPGGVGVLNVDDPALISIKKSLDTDNIITFGIENKGDVRAENIKTDISGSEFDLSVRDNALVRIKTSLIGRHNIYNMLAAAAAVMKSGISVMEIKKGLENVSGPPGRLEKVISNAPFNVFIDYAHTPDAMKNVLECLKPMTEGELICVFGCGGDRDKTKRSIMGKIVSSLAEKVIITSDNPRTEDPLMIIREIKGGIVGNPVCKVIEKRYNAINEALNTAGENDIVLIAGKGHEDHQIVGKEKMRFNDKEVVREILGKMGYSNVSE